MMGDANLRKVYEQYWLHARHVENETWLFTRVYVILVGAVFGAISAPIIPPEIKASLALFGAILSVAGFFVVYTLRVPFLKFALTAELIAINEFKLKDEYRRFFPRGGKAFPEDKWFDLHDMLAIFYSLVAGLMIYFLVNFHCLWWFTIAGVSTFVGLVCFHYGIIRRKKYIKEISDVIAAEIPEKLR